MSFGQSRGTAKAKAITRLETAPFFCGSEPAREAGDALYLVNRCDAFASRLAPTFRVIALIWRIMRQIWVDASTGRPFRQMAGIYLCIL